jgi:hypothetical protein
MTSPFYGVISHHLLEMIDFPGNRPNAGAVKKRDLDSTAITGHQKRSHDFSRLQSHAEQVRYFRPNLTVIVEPSFNVIV